MVKKRSKVVDAAIRDIDGFAKVRYFGILSNRFSKRISMYHKPSRKVKDETANERIKRLTG